MNEYAIQKNWYQLTDTLHDFILTRNTILISLHLWFDAQVYVAAQIFLLQESAYGSPEFFFSFICFTHSHSTIQTAEVHRMEPVWHILYQMYFKCLIHRVKDTWTKHTVITKSRMNGQEKKTSSACGRKHEKSDVGSLNKLMWYQSHIHVITKQFQASFHPAWPAHGWKD